jgi:AcrR family transcriptional regulator
MPPRPPSATTHGAPEVPRAQYHHGDLRHALLTATVEILAEVGAEAFTLREAARRAGVNHRAIYRHFEDKRALLAAVAEEGYLALAAETRAALAAIEIPPGAPAALRIERLVALAEAYLRFARREPARYQVMFGPRLNADARFPSLEEAIAASVAVLAGELRALAPAATSRARRDAGVALWSAIHGLSALVLAGRVPLADRHVRSYVAALLTPIVEGIARRLVPAE